jgi:hypothetical protein
MTGSSSSCPSDSEETKIITTSIPKRDTVTRRHEDESASLNTNVKQGLTSRDVKKRPFYHFLSFISDTSNPIGYATTTIHAFINDSIRLVRRCNKPDGQGMFFFFQYSNF